MDEIEGPVVHLIYEDDYIMARMLLQYILSAESNVRLLKYRLHLYIVIYREPGSVALQVIFNIRPSSSESSQLSLSDLPSLKKLSRDN
jgi:hypothetical protein